MIRASLTLLAFVALVFPAPAGETGVKKSIAYVQKLQTENGGFRSHDPKPDSVKIVPTLRATSGAVRALKYLGGDLPRKDTYVKFVESCWNAEAGAFSDEPNGKPDVFSTAVGLMAVVELKMPADKYIGAASKYLGENAKSFEEIRIAAAGFESIKRKSPSTEKWVGDVVKTQNKNGSFGKGPGMARDTASAMVTLLRFGNKPPDSKAKGFIKILDIGQRQNGGWGKADSEIASDLETTYRVMRCYMMLKARPANVEGVRSFIAKCRNPDGGYAVAPGQPSSVGGTYFASIILHWLKENP